MIYHLKRMMDGWMDGGRGLGRQQLNCLINTYLIKQNLNKFSEVFVKQMVYQIFADLLERPVHACLN